MYIVKVLKRKDAASIVVAIWLALALNQLLSLPTLRLGNWISGLNDDAVMSSLNWRTEYLNPFVSFILQLIVLEILIRLFVWIHPMIVRKSK